MASQCGSQSTVRQLPPRSTWSAGRCEWRLQELAFELARDLTRQFASGSAEELPVQALFPQVLRIVNEYLHF